MLVCVSIINCPITLCNFASSPLRTVKRLLAIFAPLPWSVFSIKKEWGFGSKENLCIPPISSIIWFEVSSSPIGTDSSKILGISRRNSSILFWIDWSISLSCFTSVDKDEAWSFKLSSSLDLEISLDNLFKFSWLVSKLTWAIFLSSSSFFHWSILRT